MRTTVTIDDDVFAAARAMARQERKPMGAIMSRLMRKGLEGPSGERSRHGIPQLPLTDPDALVTLEIVNALRDEAA